MLNSEETIQPSVVKTSRLRAMFHPGHASHEVDPNAPTLKDQASQWMDAHPWGALGLAFGVAGLLGYSLGVRS
ncbi:hypothetical protein [Oligoflexus tunisiensis]|uniref:hypothetical protein n=1 Tax=Oligoflexus tunisiensis TaxID=708132 RepID=UPI00114C9008|nr:hypothetical protein [Oligoflexus tunisiensis]